MKATVTWIRDQPNEEVTLDHASTVTTSQDLIDLSQITAAFRRQWKLMAGVAAGALALTAAAYVMQTPMYAATARVGIDRQAPTEIVTTDKPAQPVTADSNSVDTEVQALRSIDLAGAVVDRLGAQGNDRSAAINNLLNGLSVQREGLSYAISLTYKSDDPAEAAKVANTFAQAYVDARKAARTKQRETEIKLLADRLDQLKNDAIRAEGALASYKAVNNLAGSERAGSAMESSISDLTGQLARARADRAAAEARAAGGRSIQDSPVLRELRTQQATLSSQVRDMAGKYGPAHPALTAAQRQLSEVERLIGQEISRAHAASRADVDATRGAAASIQGVIGQVQGRMASATMASARLAELQREADSAETLYSAMLDRYRQNLAAQGTERSSAYVLSQASAPSSPSSPSRPLFAGFGLALAMVSALGVAGIREIGSRGFRSRIELERATRLRVLGAVLDVSTIRDAREFSGTPMSIASYLLRDKGAPFAEAFRSIRAGLRIGQASQRYKTISITSAVQGEGKSVTSLCLARSLAQAGIKVVIVDCDFRRQMLTEAFGSPDVPGLVDILKGTVEVGGAMVKDEPSGAFAILSGRTTPDDYDLISSGTVPKLLEALGASFDVVLLDTPPVISVTESRVLASQCDATIVVVQWQRTPKTLVERTLTELDEAGANVVGTVLSQVDARKTSSMGYEAHYYRRYG
jgi:capsular exopolysaccharide synthesis family protein